jgi:predicted HTH domain antitoxin
VIIPDVTLKQAGLTEKDALIEIACRLFDGDKLHLWPAAKLAGLSRDEFESALIQFSHRPRSLRLNDRPAVTTSTGFPVLAPKEHILWV